MTPRAQAEEILRGLGTRPDDEIDLAEGALALAALDRPGVALDRYRDHIVRLADDVGDALAGGDVTLVDALNQVVLQSHGYHGDMLTYDDIQNANLMRVIDRKKGLPVALGILYLHAARAHGFAADGINFPGHFMIRTGEDGARLIIDPFNEGIERSAVDLRELLKATAGMEAELSPQHYAAVGNRDILVRLQNNIKARHERAGRPEDALRVVEGMLMFAPAMMALWREAGVIHARLGNLGAAIEAFQTIVEGADTDAARHDAAAIVQKLKARLH
ncbi:MAG: regulator of sirC expression with transglutaminase-like and TPR domain [Paracoccaceae bacterium]|jgi:regulator of sirC expression with transglutaminase-like and TPR domain